MKRILSVYEKALPPELTLYERLVEAGKAGFDALELSIDETEEKLSRLCWSNEQRRELKNAVADSGVGINTICLSGHRKYPLGSADPATEKRGLEIAEKAIEFAYDVGVRIIQLAGYDVYYEPSDESTRERFAENLARVVGMASKRGVILGFETMETDFMNTVSKAMKYVRLINSPYLQIYPDVGNVYNGTDDVLKDIESGRGHICAAHLKETLPGVFRNMHYGDGRVDFPAVISALKEQGVGIYNAEFWYDPQWLSGDWRQALRDAHGYLRPLLED